MDKIRIQGGQRLSGSLRISGAKNAALPLMAACLLTDAPLTLTNLPHLADITTMANLLAQHGVELHFEGDVQAGGHMGRVLELRARAISSTTAPYDLVRKMRASVLVLGPLVARCGQARVSLPGGCAIGSRPVDFHIDGLKALGAEITLEDGYILARAPKGLRGGKVVMPVVSVGATENLLMAAVLATGASEIVNAACEPEITDLAQCLQRMGARIEGVGTHHLRIQGVPALQAATHPIIPDRIETGTFAIAAAITRGDLTLEDAAPEHNEALWRALRAAGCRVECADARVRVQMDQRPKPVDMDTAPYPGFPTDLQAQWLALMALAEGDCLISETIFENRFMHVPELARMGADIRVHGAVARVHGVSALKGAPVMATDLRASVSLVLAALAADGESTLARVYHLDRGYERIEQKLTACGARIQRLKEIA